MSTANAPPGRKKTMNGLARSTIRLGRVNIWTFVGLTIVLISEPLLMSSPIRSLFQATGSDAVVWFLNMASIFLIQTLVICCLIFGEGGSLSSIGFTRPRLSAIMTGVAYGLALVTFFISAIWILVFFHINAFENKISNAGAPNLPFWEGLLISFGSGFAIETLYRGYAISRLTMILKNPWFAGVAVLAVGIAARAPFWSPFMLASQMALGVFFSILFISKRDLTLSIAAHISVLLALDLLPFLA